MDTHKHIKVISPQQYREYLALAMPGTVIIDVRTKDEYESGHLPDAQLIDFYDLDFEKIIKTLDRKGVYFLYCRSGGRSGQALDVFNKYDFTQVYSLDGGLLGSPSFELVV